MFLYLIGAVLLVVSLAGIILLVFGLFSGISLLQSRLTNANARIAVQFTQLRAINPNHADEHSRDPLIDEDTDQNTEDADLVFGRLRSFGLNIRRHSSQEPECWLPDGLEYRDCWARAGDKVDEPEILVMDDAQHDEHGMLVSEGLGGEGDSRSPVQKHS